VCCSALGLVTNGRVDATRLVTLCCSVLQGMLQDVAVCGVLQRVVVRCGVLQCPLANYEWAGGKLCCGVLQCVL